MIALLPSKIRTMASRYRRHCIALVVGGVALLAIAGLSTLVLLVDREQELSSAEHEMSALSLTLAEAMSRTFQSIDLLLLGLQEKIRADHIDDVSSFQNKLSSQETHQYLVERAHNLPQLDALAIIDSTGQNIANSRPLDQGIKPSVADRDYFVQQKEHPELGVYFGSPAINRITGEWTLFVSRRIDASDGSFLGVTVAVLKADYFQKFFATVAPGPASTISLFRRDGLLLARHPDSSQFIGRSFGAQPLFTQVIATHDSGVIRTPASAFDAIARSMAPRAILGYPLIINITNTRDAILTGWRGHVSIVLGIAIAMTALLVVAVALFMRQTNLQVRAASLEARESEARQSEQRIRAITDNLPVVITYRDKERRLRFVNKAAEPWYGRPADELIGKTPLMLGRTPAVDDDSLYEKLRKGPVRFERPGTRGDGSARTLEVVNIPDFDSDGSLQGYFTLATDVTQRKATEEQLRLTQGLQAIGKLTGGVAHDFNNLLGVIAGNLELVLDDLRDDQGQTKRMLQAALRAAARGATLTKSLLAFSRQQPLNPVEIDVAKLISESVEVIRRTIPATIEIEVVLSGGLWKCEADPGQLQNALINLVVNARDAMPDGGRLTIDAGNARLDDEYAATHAEVKPGQYVQIAVSDTGTGMPPDVVARAFEPFFTTKSTGRGTGLGLSMVYGFAKQSGGHVKIYSEVGQGTTVRIYLPRSSTNAVQQSAFSGAEPARAHGETILVVEDDNDFLTLTFSLLRSLGYNVLIAQDGAEAIRLVDQHPEINLLLTDVILPGDMNGRKLAEAIVTRKPGIKVLYMSGYTENAILHHGRLDRGVQLLQKPFTKIELAEKVNAIIHGPREPDAC